MSVPEIGRSSPARGWQRSALKRCELCQKCKSLSKKCKIKSPFNFASFEAADQWAPRLVLVVEKIITNHEF